MSIYPFIQAILTHIDVYRSNPYTLLSMSIQPIDASIDPAA